MMEQPAPVQQGAAPDYAPGMRVIVRGMEWLVQKVETNTLGNPTL